MMNFYGIMKKRIIIKIKNYENMSIIDEHPICIPKRHKPELAIKRKENHSKWVNKVLNELIDNQVEYHDYIFDLVECSLEKMTQQKLKFIFDGFQSNL